MAVDLRVTVSTLCLAASTGQLCARDRLPILPGRRVQCPVQRNPIATLLPLDVAHFAQASAECGNEIRSRLYSLHLEFDSVHSSLGWIVMYFTYEGAGHGLLCPMLLLKICFTCLWQQLAV